MLNKILRYDKYIAIFSVLALFLILGGTYALTSWRTSNYNIALDSACLDINYTKGQNINETVGTINESVYLSNNVITMNSNMAFTSVSIELDEDCYDINGLATIKINVTNLSNNFKIGGNAYGKLMYVVAEYDPTDYNTLTKNNLVGHNFDVVARGSILNTGTVDAYTKYIEPGEVKNYLVIFYSREVNVLLTGSSFGASIDAEVVQFSPTPIGDFTYAIGSFEYYGGTNMEIPEGKVLLLKYNGRDQIVNVPSTYTIDGVDYTPVIYADPVNAESTFSDNRYIETVNFSSGVLFGEVWEEESFVIDSSMQSTFYGCTSLVNVSGISKSLTSMANTFSGCTSLITVPVIPSSVTYMGGTFSGCTSLVTAPTIPSSVTDMTDTFYGCSSLVTAPTIPSSVTDMGGTFSGCTSLVTAPTIPSSVTNMTSTFRGCTNLTGTIKINSSNVTRLSGSTYHPFYGTSSSNAITVEVPSGSTTYNNIYNNKPSNVTIVTY